MVRAGSVPWTILRATQFFDFADMVVGWLTEDGVATVPPLLMQPVAVSEVADVLAELAAAPPLNDIVEFGGPKPADFIDLARRTLAARGDSTELIPAWRDGPFGVQMAGNVLLPSHPRGEVRSPSRTGWRQNPVRPRTRGPMRATGASCARPQPSKGSPAWRRKA